MSRALLVLGIVGVVFATAVLLRPSALVKKVDVPAGAQRLKIAYGELADQHGELWLPPGEGSHPVVVLVHGGFWGSAFGSDLMDALAADLVDRGWAAWNIEYRRVGGGGGWPATFEDVAAATDHLTEMARPRSLDLTRVVTVGHSAGGHLAVWLASRSKIPAGFPGAEPRVEPALAISQAGVLDLEAGADAGLGSGAVAALMGGPPQRHPERYAAGSPVALAPAGVPVVLVHGEADRLVPIGQSRLYQQAAGGVAVELVSLPGGHFEHLDPASAEWAAVVEALATVATPEATER